MANFGGNMALNIEQRLGQKLTNEQQLLWNYLLKTWPNLTFAPLYYMGVSAGSEFLTYSANKIYIGYSLEVSSSQVPSAFLASVTLYDASNAAHQSLRDCQIYWDATAAAFRSAGNNVMIQNVWFSRLVFAASYDQLVFIGYRLTI